MSVQEMQLIIALLERLDCDCIGADASFFTEQGNGSPGEWLVPILKIEEQLLVYPALQACSLYL